MDIQDFLDQRGQYRQGQASIIFYSLFVITNRIQTGFDKVVEDITFKQFMLLILIEILGSGSYSDFASVMGSSRQNVKNLAVALEKKGYVKIEQNKEDRRASLVRSTDKVKKHFDTMNMLYEDRMEELFADFTDQEIGGLFTMMGKFFAGIERMEEEDEAGA